MQIEAENQHSQSAEFYDDIGTGRQLDDGALPGLELLFRTAGIRAHTQASANVIEDDRRVRESAGERGDLGELRVVAPALERQAEFCQPREAGAPGGIARNSFLHKAGDMFADLARVVRNGPANAAHSAAGEGDLLLQDVLDFLTQAKIGVTDDRHRHASGAMAAARTHGGNPIDELDLSERPFGVGGTGAVVRSAFDEDGGFYVMATTDIAKDVRQQIRATVVVPQMVMWIDDRQIRFKCLLLSDAGDPAV